MSLDCDDIIKGLYKLGLKKGDTVLVHSSLSSLGHVEGGAETVIKALLSAAGEQGTVAVPTLTGKSTDSKACPPVFDVRSSVCWTGTIPETFRKMKDARRSLHPTHSIAAIGLNRDEIISGHETGNSPCDMKSPYYKNCMMSGKILLIGVSQNSNTSIHMCEEISKVPYHLQKELTDIWIKDYYGNGLLVRNHLHDWGKPETDFNRMEPLMIKEKIINIGKIGNADVRLIDAKSMLELAKKVLTDDPWFLVIEKPNI